jgi:hypothetical protein
MLLCSSASAELASVRPCAQLGGIDDHLDLALVAAPRC